MNALNQTLALGDLGEVAAKPGTRVYSAGVQLPPRGCRCVHISSREHKLRVKKRNPNGTSAGSIAHHATIRSSFVKASCMALNESQSGDIAQA
ncbi:MAG: hypothetical protein ACR2JB_06615 [Bryobacteraceae bacterium]